jgi:hypothetical protein
MGGLVAAACNAAMTAFANASRKCYFCKSPAAGAGLWLIGLLESPVRQLERKERGTVMAWWRASYVPGGFLAAVFATYAATQMSASAGLGWRRGRLFPAVVLAAAALWLGWRAENSPPDAKLSALGESPGELYPRRGSLW